MRSRATPIEDVSSDTTQLLVENTLAGLGNKKDFKLGPSEESQENQSKHRNASMLSQNRQASIVSDSKLTQQYSQMWENEEDR